MTHELYRFAHTAVTAAEFPISSRRAHCARPTHFRLLQSCRNKRGRDIFYTDSPANTPTTSVHCCNWLLRYQPHLSSCYDVNGASYTRPLSYAAILDRPILSNMAAQGLQNLTPTPLLLSGFPLTKCMHRGSLTTRARIPSMFPLLGGVLTY